MTRPARKGNPEPFSLLETFPTPADAPFVIEHVAEEFTTLCPKTGHPDFGRVILRYAPGAHCVELKSLKLYYQSFRDQGIFYEAVTNRIRDDLVEVLSPRWLQVVTEWRGRGGIHSRIIAGHGALIARFPIWYGGSLFPSSSRMAASMPGNGFPIDPGLISIDG